MSRTKKLRKLKTKTQVDFNPYTNEIMVVSTKIGVNNSIYYGWSNNPKDIWTLERCRYVKCFGIYRHNEERRFKSKSKQALQRALDRPDEDVVFPRYGRRFSGYWD